MVFWLGAGGVLEFCVWWSMGGLRGVCANGGAPGRGGGGRRKGGAGGRGGERGRGAGIGAGVLGAGVFRYVGPNRAVFSVGRTTIATLAVAVVAAAIVMFGPLGVFELIYNNFRVT